MGDGVDEPGSGWMIIPWDLPELHTMRRVTLGDTMRKAMQNRSV